MPSCLLLSTLLGSALFAGLGEVAVGRLLVEGGHRALILGPAGAYLLEGEANSALYGLARRPGGYLAVGHLGERLLRVTLDAEAAPSRPWWAAKASSGGPTAASPGGATWGPRAGRRWS